VIREWSPRCLILVLAVLVTMRAEASHAHAVGVSRGDYRVVGAEIHAELVFARKELISTRSGFDTDGDGDLGRDEIINARPGLVDWMLRGVSVRTTAAICEADVHDIAPIESDGISFSLVYRCSRMLGAFAVKLALFDELSAGHRHLLATSGAGLEPAHAVLYESRPQFETPLSSERRAGASSTGQDPATGARSVASSMFNLGVEHILTGYDHLLFVLALVLVAGPVRSLVAAITAFTLAHSITLAVAAFGIWTPGPSLVEPAIALSIAFVGIENCFVADLRRRWRLTFAFGLIHGFGFAGALGEIALPASQVPLALASFNAGVELGQLAVLALVLPSLWFLARLSWFRKGAVEIASAAIATMGLWWFAERIGGA
jgi:hydrogenase/urease accessory protein HupE